MRGKHLPHHQHSLWLHVLFRSLKECAASFFHTTSILFGCTCCSGRGKSTWCSGRGKSAQQASSTPPAFSLVARVVQVVERVRSKRLPHHQHSLYGSTWCSGRGKSARQASSTPPALSLVAHGVQVVERVHGKRLPHHQHYLWLHVVFRSWKE